MSNQVAHVCILCKYYLEAEQLAFSISPNTKCSLVISSHPMPYLETGSDTSASKRIPDIWENISNIDENLLCISWLLIVSKQ